MNRSIICLYLLLILLTVAVRTAHSYPLEIPMSPSLSELWKEQQAAPLRPAAPREAVPLERAIDPGTYVLGPNDEVTIGIWDEISQSFPLTITPEGSIIFSPAGLIAIGDLTVREAERRVSEVLQTYYPNVRITLTLTGIRPIKVHISGEVYYPGSYEMTPVDRVFDLIQTAGGLLPGGSVRNISIINPVASVAREPDFSGLARIPATPSAPQLAAELLVVDLEGFLQKGEIEENPLLRAGDLVYIPPKTSTILVRGEVHGRISPGLLQQRIPEPPEELVRGAKTEIFLEYREGDLLSDAIARAGGLRETADLNSAYLIRRNLSTSDSTIAIDLYRLLVLEDPAADIFLRKGDIIEIPMDLRLVYVVGRVANPGPIPYQANLGAYGYVGMAGGPTIDGSNRGWKVIDEEGRSRRIKPDEIVASGQTVMVPERFITKLGKILSPVSAAATIIISIVALQR